MLACLMQVTDIKVEVFGATMHTPTPIPDNGEAVLHARVHRVRQCHSLGHTQQ